ncbi:MAG: hypothetical protein JNK48_07510 [Bryobacterales bacterium]|nr:hypothetical protein [Bryobacterales bacterium]
MERRFLWMLLWGAGAVLAQLPPACTPFPNGCLYNPGPPQPTAGSTATVSYRDAVGQTRTLEVFVRVPLTAQGALPVVLWSHDGEGTTDSKSVLTAWSESTAKAGYLTVSIAHTPRTEDEKTRFCAAAAIPEENCPYLNLLMLDAPNDLKRVLDWLEELNQSGPAEIRGRIDLRRIALAGHGEGANAGISLAGARRLLTAADAAKPNDFTDPRPAVFIGLSPQGPQQAGFFDSEVGRPTTSWTAIERPVLGITSAGDNTCLATGACAIGDSPSRRRIPFEAMPRGNKYELFLKTVEVSHDMLGSLDTAACASQGIAPATCANVANWLQATVLAFLDAQLRGVASARAWLQGDLIQPASANTAEWRKK